MTARVTKALSVALAALLVGACGGSADPDEVHDDQAVAPADPPADWTTARVGGVTYSHPADWAPIDSAPQTPIATTIGTDRNEAGTHSGATVAVVSPEVSAESLARSYLDEGRALFNAHDDLMEEVSWPGADAAWYVSFLSEVPAGGQFWPHATEYLIADVGDTQVQVNASAWEEDDAVDQIHEVLQSVNLQDAQTEER